MNAAIDDTTIKAIINEIAVVIEVNIDVSSVDNSVYKSNGITVAAHKNMIRTSHVNFNIFNCK